MMRYRAIAFDYDGTLAYQDRVDGATVAALERLRAASRKLILVTGRRRDDLLQVFPQVRLFDRVIAENGALLYRPATGEERLLGDPPSPEFVAALRERRVTPLSIGRVIVATWEPQQTTVLQVIRALGLQRQVIFNKGAVMVLPAGIDKGSGLRAALDELGLPPANAIAVGDAENDLPSFNLCGYSVAVANALPTVKQRAAFVTRADHGAGIREFIDWFLVTDRG
jgi:hypothetical protein